MTDNEITITFTVREARALVNTAGLIAEAFEHVPIPILDGLESEQVRPLEAACMKLDCALICEGAAEL